MRILGGVQNLERRDAGCDTTDCIEYAETLRALRMKRLDVGVQPIPGQAQVFGHFNPLLFGGTRSTIPASSELREDGLPIRLVRVKLQYRVT